MPSKWVRFWEDWDQWRHGRRLPSRADFAGLPPTLYVWAIRSKAMSPAEFAAKTDAELLAIPQMGAKRLAQLRALVPYQPLAPVPVPDWMHEE